MWEPGALNALPLWLQVHCVSSSKQHLEAHSLSWWDHGGDSGYHCLSVEELEPRASFPAAFPLQLSLDSIGY